MTASSAPIRASEVGLDTVYELETSGDPAGFYDAWADGYDDELAENGYVTPRRCAEALAAHVADLSAPVLDLACGTGLSGAALRAAGFACIDGLDISEEMLARARARGVYRDLAVRDLAEPLDIAPGTYANAAAIGCLAPGHIPCEMIDRILGILEPGGCFVFSLNDHALADGSYAGRVMEAVDTCHAELLMAEHGAHLPGIGLEATVYVLRRR